MNVTFLVDKEFILQFNAKRHEMRTVALECFEWLYSNFLNG